MTTNKEAFSVIEGNDNNSFNEVYKALRKETEISNFTSETILNFLKKENINVCFLIQKNKIKLDESYLKNLKESNFKNSDIAMIIVSLSEKDLCEKYGFKSVTLEFGNLIMVNKGFELKLDDILDLKTKRKNALDWFNNNDFDDSLKKVKDFIESKEKETNNKKTNKKEKNRP